MSQYSDNGSVISLNGKEQSIEDAMDSVIAEIQQQLNNSQYSIRQLAMASDQNLEFQEEVKFCDNLQDHLLQIQRLFMDLLDISDQLISIPETKQDKDFWKQHKKDRKQYIKQKLKEYNDNKKTEKEERKKNREMDDITE